MAIEGPLKELGLHDVFQLLDLSRKTGVLRVTSQLRRNQGTVHFDRGAVVYAEVRSNPHPLGSMLVRSGKVTEADLRLAQDIQRRGDRRRLGEILVGMGALAQRELERQVRFQVEEVIFEVMGWREGYFSFVEGPLADVGADATVRIPTEALLMEGARRIDEWSRIERVVPHLGIVPTLAMAPGAEGAVDLLPPEWEVLAAIDGTRDLRALAAHLGRSEFDVAKTVFGLHAAGVLEVIDPGMQRNRAAGDLDADEALSRVEALLKVRELEAARAEAEVAVTTYPQEAGAHVALAGVHLAAGRAREAEDAARHALRLDPMRGAAHRMLGDALALEGRFAEAVEWWERWLTLADSDESETPERERVRAATDAARTLDQVLRGAHGR